MDGFFQLRRGIEEHLLNGSLSFQDLGVYVTILLQADYRTGQWWGSAPRLAATAPRAADLRTIQRSIERLQSCGFLKVFRRSHGARGNYGVLINKFEPSSGALKGKRLNAFASISYAAPVYEDCAEPTVSGRCVDGEPSLSSRCVDGEGAPSQDARCNEKIEKRSSRSISTAIGSGGPIQFQSGQQQSDSPEIELTRYFHQHLLGNPFATAMPAKWESLWKRDIAELLRTYSVTDLQEIIEASQEPRWQKYVIRGEGLKKMAEPIMSELRKASEEQMSALADPGPAGAPEAEPSVDVEELDGLD